MMQSVNPATGEVIKTYTPHAAEEVEQKINAADACFNEWRLVPFPQRARLMRRAAELLRQHKNNLAQMMQDEMGKVLKDGLAEIEKCAVTCEYYADNAESMLTDQIVKTEARKSMISYQPLGVILAVMPWNFPFWQVIRFAAPNLMAGNVGILKHASNVCGCALALEGIFRDAGFPDGCFTTLLIESKTVDTVIEHHHVRAVTLTGSNTAGKSVAAKAGSCLKKTVLELGGSDAYVVLEDADIKSAAIECAKSRLINAGQSCIAAKRFIILESVKAEFTQHFINYFKTIAAEDIGPLARIDLRDDLHQQVEKSIQAGAKLLLGGKIPDGKGAFYPPTILDNVCSGMPAFDEELFGPVAALITAKNEEQAFQLANQSSFGLGGAIFTSNLERGEQLAKTHMDAAQVFVNALVKSDPRLPFGGIKESGYGRELSSLGIYEFMNAKTVYIA